MRTIRAMLVPALAVLGMAATEPGFAQERNQLARPEAGQSRHYGGDRQSGPRQPGSRPDGRWNHDGNRHWNRDGYRHWYRGDRHWGHSHSYWGLTFGLPLFWGWPYYDPFYYPRPYVYREVEVVPEYVGEIGPPTTEVAPAPGAPTQGPLYMNYCESAKAYFPTVTSCPEGWKVTGPTR